MRDIFLLILLQAFWSSSYVAMKIALSEMPLGLVMILRYGTTLAALACVGGFRGWRFGRRDCIIIVAVGVLDFTLSPFLQLSSLQLTFATDTAILVAFEPVLTTLMAVLVLRERLELQTIGVFLVATVGVLIMSDVGATAAHTFTNARIFGNVIFLLSLLCESLYSVTSRYSTQRHDPRPVFTLMTAAAVISNLAIHGETLRWAHLSHISLAGWSAVAFLGLGCSFFAYGRWTALTQRLPIKQITLSLYLQPIIGGVVAFFMLGEVPSLRTIAGAMLIVATLFVWTWWKTRSESPRETCPVPQKMLANRPS